MEAPHCPICGAKHWGSDHQWTGGTAKTAPAVTGRETAALQAEIKRLKAELATAHATIASLTGTATFDPSIASNGKVHAKAPNLTAEAPCASPATLMPPARATGLESKKMHGKRGRRAKGESPKSAAERQAAYRLRRAKENPPAG